MMMWDSAAGVDSRNTLKWCRASMRRHISTSTGLVHIITVRPSSLSSIIS